MESDIDRLLYREQGTIFAHIEYVPEIDPHNTERGENGTAEEEDRGSYRGPAFGVRIVHVILDERIDYVYE